MVTIRFANFDVEEEEAWKMERASRHNRAIRFWSPEELADEIEEAIVDLKGLGITYAEVGSSPVAGVIDAVEARLVDSSLEEFARRLLLDARASWAKFRETR